MQMSDTEESRRATGWSRSPFCLRIFFGVDQDNGGGASEAAHLPPIGGHFLNASCRRFPRDITYATRSRTSSSRNVSSKPVGIADTLDSVIDSTLPALTPVSLDGLSMSVCTDQLSPWMLTMRPWMTLPSLSVNTVWAYWSLIALLGLRVLSSRSRTL